MRSYLLIGFFLLFSIVATVMSQDMICDTTCDTNYTTEIVYDTTISPRPVKCFKIPVTYYDYHVDGSNPDFGYRVTSRWDQTGLSYANMSGWVDTALSSENMSPQRHPALADTFLDISWNIGKLFTPWADGSMDTFTLKFPPIVKDTIVDTFLIQVDTTYSTSTVYEIDTVYNPDSTFVLDTLSSHIDTTMNIWIDTLTSIVLYDSIPVPDTIMISDTMFKNIVIEDSLTAYWLPNEISYDDTTDTMWTFGKREKMDPINGRGFGNESDSTQNAGYTIRLHNQITYKGGEKLYFGADDDFYVFINGKLAAECGGFHEAIIDSLYLDSLYLDGAQLTIDEKYEIDIFMVERRMGGNIFLAGLSDSNFVNEGAVQVDTFYDTLIDYHFDTTHTKITRNITCTGVNSPYKKPQIQTLFGLKIPPSSEYVTFEYFTISGAKVMDRKLPLALALANKFADLPCGMYIIRINFLNAQGKRLSRPSFHKLMVRK
ncbi:MAG: fibro-slime domain-containing protein [Chitinispirillaceae bacterium]|nr:fibro-slime domain-containing protein [Chitinispirillaceae bacterium]